MAKRWTEDHDNYLRTWGYVGDFCMAMDLGRSRQAVRDRAKKLGVVLNDKDGCAHDHVDAERVDVCTCGAPLWPVHKYDAKLERKAREKVKA